MTNSSAAYEQLKQKLKVRLAELLERDAGNGQRTSLERHTILTQLRQVLQTAQEGSHKLTLGAQEQEQLLEELANEIVGGGPLEPLLMDPGVTEIMVNGPRQVYVERQGRLERTAIAFRDTHQLMSVVERLLDAAGTSVTGSEPCVDASLPNGTRLHVIIPPVALNGPILTIRKRLRQWTMDALLAQQALTPQAAEFLEACVKAKANLLISGGTSTGKTTLVSVLSGFIPPHERIITIENVAELELLNREHWIRLVARTSNVEGKGEITLRVLVRNALRMRPDRLILGEARSGEALDVVQAMHTGHEGVMTVLHANSAHAALDRLETLMLMSEVELPAEACRMQTASAIDVIIHTARHTGGSRRIASIAQVLGSSTGGFQLEELFAFVVQGFHPDGSLEGALRYTGAHPKFLHKFQLSNVPVPVWLA